MTLLIIIKDGSIDYNIRILTVYTRLYLDNINSWLLVLSYRLKWSANAGHPLNQIFIVL